MWHSRAFLSRFLLFLASTILVVMPWTEHCWSFDGFTHGRPDLELSLLAIVTMLCLVLLLASTASHDVSVLLALRRWFCRVWHRVDRIAHVCFCGFRCESKADPTICPASGLWLLPLQI